MSRESYFKEWYISVHGSQITGTSWVVNMPVLLLRTHMKTACRKLFPIQELMAAAAKTLSLKRAVTETTCNTPDFQHTRSHCVDPSHRLHILSRLPLSETTILMSPVAWSMFYKQASLAASEWQTVLPATVAALRNPSHTSSVTVLGTAPSDSPSQQNYRASVIFRCPNNRHWNGGTIEI